MAPLTGDAGFLGVEQLSWAKYAVQVQNKLLGLKVGLYQGDTQLDPALASTLAQKYVSDPKTMAIIGPSTSSAVQATGPTFAAANLVAISPSATRTSLTIGSDTAGKSFYRDVPHDGIQGPSDAAYMVNKLKAKKVYIIDDQESYSTGLADAAGAALRAKGVTVIRDSVSQSVTDFSSIVTKVPGDTDVVFLPWQQAPQAQTFAQQMAEQGKKAKIFGSDGTNAPDKFKFPGALRVELRAGHHRHPAGQGARRRVEEGQPRDDGRQLRPADLRCHPDRDAGAQGGLHRRRGQGHPRRRARPGAEGEDQAVDPRRFVGRASRRPTTRSGPSSTSSRSSRTGATSSSAEPPEMG